jgi:hypothetical protein
MELAPLLEEAGAASPANRIQWRDRIAAHGSRAIEGIKPWLADPILAAFAVRVIERAGTSGEAEHATQVLRSARSKVPMAVKGDIDWAIHQLRAPSQPKTSASHADRPQAGSAPRPLRRQEPYLSPLGRPRTRRSAPIRPR